MPTPLSGLESPWVPFTPTQLLIRIRTLIRTRTVTTIPTIRTLTVTRTHTVSMAAVTIGAADIVTSIATSEASTGSVDVGLAAASAVVNVGRGAATGVNDNNKSSRAARTTALSRHRAALL
jgi:hypothetical protein